MRHGVLIKKGLIDFAKLGKLVLANGQWAGTTVIDQGWIQKSLAKRYLPDYGYHWYIPNDISYYEEGQLKDFYAEGVWGQVLYISPTLNTIILASWEK